MNDFINTKLSTPHPVSGYSSLPGIQGWVYIRTQGYEGYSITLQENVIEEERKQILDILSSSPIIYKVFENVVPSEIVLDSKIAEEEKKAIEKQRNDNRPVKKMVVRTIEKP